MFVFAQTQRVRLREVFGVDDPRRRIAETWLAVRGDASLPPTRFGPSSLGLFAPWISWPLWAGFDRSDGRVRITNFFNRTPTPPEDGWSVRVTQVRDWRGGRLTYDSHNGTDFACPPGTLVTAPADGRVIRVSNEFNRGGLKVFIEHGHGVATSCNHLARALVARGDRIRRGQAIALSGYSGLDGLLFGSVVAPHVHFNVFLDGRHTDPFADRGTDEASLWLGGEPLHHSAAGSDAPIYAPAEWDEPSVARTMAGCRDPRLVSELEALDLDGRASALLFQTSYFPTRFEVRPRLYAHGHPKRPMLSLPFDGYEGAWYPV